MQAPPAPPPHGTYSFQSRRAATASGQSAIVRPAARVRAAPAGAPAESTLFDERPCSSVPAPHRPQSNQLRPAERDRQRKQLALEKKQERVTHIFSKMREWTDMDTIPDRDVIDMADDDLEHAYILAGTEKFSTKEEFDEFGNTAGNNPDGSRTLTWEQYVALQNMHLENIAVNPLDPPRVKPAQAPAHLPAVSRETIAQANNVIHIPDENSLRTLDTIEGIELTVPRDPLFIGSDSFRTVHPYAFLRDPSIVEECKMAEQVEWYVNELQLERDTPQARIFTSTELLDKRGPFSVGMSKYTSQPYMIRRELDGIVLAYLVQRPLFVVCKFDKLAPVKPLPLLHPARQRQHTTPGAALVWRYKWAGYRFMEGKATKK